MKKIKKLLNVILEIEAKVKTPILINPTLNEIKKKLYEAKRIHGYNPASLRFVIVDNDYYIADAIEWIHNQIVKEMKLSISEDNHIYGEFTDDGYLWFFKYQLFNYFKLNTIKKMDIDNNEIINLFKETNLYDVIKSIINKIEYQ